MAGFWCVSKGTAHVFEDLGTDDGGNWTGIAC